ncbi:TIGR03067 domain-containing protein [Gemmata sp.]|uniref:TIGR03067 domain-containing protein n=1 Tax=Gemmata sp. TaxID=1914242 RepID=UPI003F6E6F7F
MRMNGLILAASLALTAGVGAADNKDTLKGDKEKLQGKWHIVSVAVEDTVIKREDVPREWKGTFEKDVLVEGDRFGQVGSSTARIELDETRTPKQITVRDDGGKLTFRGIYALDGDALKVCVNGDGSDVRRPEEFVTKKGTPLLLIVLKKTPADKK